MNNNIQALNSGRSDTHVKYAQIKSTEQHNMYIQRNSLTWCYHIAKQRHVFRFMDNVSPIANYNMHRESVIKRRRM